MTLKEFLDNFIDDHQNIRLVSWCPAGVLTYADCIRNGVPVKKWFDYEVMRIGMGQMDDERCYITIVIDTKESEKAKYIEIEKVWEMLHEIGGCGAEPESWADGWDKAIDEAINRLAEMPVTDVKKVKRGAWERDEYDMLCCSQCKEELAFGEVTPYCPYCGAKMNGKQK